MGAEIVDGHAEADMSCAEDLRSCFMASESAAVSRRATTHRAPRSGRAGPAGHRDLSNARLVAPFSSGVVSSDDAAHCGDRIDRPPT